jgi:ABC-type Fe3+/spermidine/putrescine transport system ATPase subunit
VTPTTARAAADAGGRERPGGCAVEVRALSKRYGAFRAVDGVSLSAGPGEFTALLGPSGSGKTTLLMAIAGFETPDAGEILVDGRDVTDLPPNRRGIGVVFQNYALFPHMSVWDNVAFPLARRGVGKRERDERVAAAIDLVRLAGHERKLPSALSGGQQQRAAIARATVFRPSLLLMDEPLGALDRRLREDMQLEIKEMQRRLGVTIVYVTHDQEEAVMMADRIAVMRAGRIEQSGSAADLYDRPATAFVADFVGQTNLVEGTLAEPAGGAPALALPGGSLMPLPGTEVDGPPGSPVAVAIRPERLRFAAPGEPGVPGTVVRSVYAGATRLFLIETAAGPVVRLRLPSRLDETGPRPGDGVTLACEPGYARVFSR